MINKDFIAATDFFSISALITLSIYHLMIYFGRRDFKEEKYNLYFALFTMSLAGYILVGALSFLQAYNDFLFINGLTPPLEGLCLIGVMFGFHFFLSPLLKLPAKQLRIVYFSSLIYVAVMLLTFTCVFKGYNWYLKHMFLWVVLFVSVYILFTFFLYGSWIIKQKLYREKTIKLILIGVAVLIVYLVITKFMLALDANNQFAKNNLIISVVIYIFAYAIAVKFNTEYKLIVLKKQLEQKVTERTIELNKSIENIERISQEKTNYFVNLAHETKTPLTLINNYLAKYIAKSGTNIEIGIIKQNLDKLSKDMVNFLDASKLERGQIFYNHDQIVSLSVFLKDKVNLFESLAHQKSISVESEIDEQIFLKADPFAIDRLLNNLLENAFKYTGVNGKISVKLKGKEKTVNLKISDNGIGMTEEQINHIFEPYYQISHQKQNIQGIGMGLYILKMIVDQIKGKISVSSNSEIGSIFSLTFNRYFPNKIEIVSDVHSTFPIEFIKNEDIVIPQIINGRRNILLIEDNSTMLNYLIDELSVNYNVYSSINGEDALIKIKSIPTPDLIISDIMMDRMDGVEFFKLISRMDKYSNIPFVFLTARSIEDEKIELLKQGAIDFINKPFSIEELKARVHSIFESKKKSRMSDLKEMIDILSDQIGPSAHKKADKSITIAHKSKQLGLTARQEEIILLISNGDEYKEIAAKLNISPKTVIRHVQNLYETLNVHNKVELLNLFIE